MGWPGGPAHPPPPSPAPPLLPSGLLHPTGGHHFQRQMKPAASRAQLAVPPESCGPYGVRAGWSTGLPSPHQPSPHLGPWKMGPAPRRDITTRRGGRGKVMTLAPLFSPKPLLLGHPADHPVCRSQGAPTAGPCQEQGQWCSRGWMGSCGDTGQRTAQGHPAERPSLETMQS